MVSILSVLVGIFILFIPGIFILYLYNKKTTFLNLTDKIVGSLLLSGIWNYLFFLPRLSPPFRTSAYILGILILIFLSFKKHYLENKFHFFKNLSLRNIFSSKNLKELSIPVLVLMLGIFLVGYPMNKLNLSRVNLNPIGGDVNFSLYKTHLLKGGYSFLDDLYFGEINSYPNFNFAQVALMSLLRGGYTGINADTYKLLISVVVFWLFYALGQGLNLRKTESILLAILSLIGYHIWSHFDVYVAASLSFLATFIFLYFSCRAFTTKNQIFWLLNGLAASLVIHSHMVHTALAGLFTVILLTSFITKQLIEKNSFSNIWKIIKPFIITASLGAIIFLGPLGLKYQFKSTHIFHLKEIWDSSIDAWIKGPLTNPTHIVAIALTVMIWIYVLFTKKKNKKEKLIIAANLLISLLLITHLVQIVSLKTHRLAVNIDSGDFYNIVSALSLTLIAIVILRIISFLLNRFIPSLKNKNTLIISEIIFTILIVILIFPNNPIRHIKAFESYNKTLWKHTLLPEAKGERAIEGNIDKNWDYFVGKINENTPLYKTALITGIGSMTAISSSLERQMVIYEEPYSNLFLKNPYDEREADLLLTIYKDPTPQKIIYLIKKYKITHFLWTWSEPEETLEAYKKSPFLEKVISPNEIGTLFKVRIK